MSRTKLVIKNMATNIGGQGIVLLLNFIQRSVFIYFLGKEYLGIQSLFTSIISVLSLADLGITEAIVFALYKPIAEKNEKKIAILMAYYAKAYKIIGMTIGIIGMTLIPFLEYFIKGDIPPINLEIVYLLYVLNTVISYFCAYKRSILRADQRGYICNIYQYIFQILQAVIQSLLLIVTSNFILYLIIQILFSILTNIFISIKADRDYPYIKAKEVSHLEIEEKKEITKNVKALFLHRIGGIVVNNTDTLLMSKFIGIGTVGLYTNYRMIITTVTNVLYQIVSSFTASLGNVGVENNEKKFYEIYKELNIGCYIMYGFSTTCLFNLLNPFIELWLGKTFLFEKRVVCLLALNFYVLGMRQLIFTARTALGLFWHDRYKPLVESLVNLIVSFTLVEKYGIEGILVGTLVSYLLVDMTVEPMVLYRHGLKRPLKGFYLEYIFEFLIVFGLNYLIDRIFVFQLETGLIGFVEKTIICSVMSITLLFLAVSWKKETRKLLIRAKKIIKK